MPKWFAVSGTLIIVTMICAYMAGAWSVRQHILSPQETVTIAEAGLSFKARLDTGAVVSSINALDIEVIGGGARASKSDTGKPVRFVLVNEHGQRSEQIATIEQVRGIRTADCREVRYHVYLTVEFAGKKHRVLMNLNDRSRSSEQLLLGRNWLFHGYAVAPVLESEL